MASSMGADDEEEFLVHGSGKPNADHAMMMDHATRAALSGVLHDLGSPAFGVVSRGASGGLEHAAGKSLSESLRSHALAPDGGGATRRHVVLAVKGPGDSLGLVSPEPGAMAPPGAPRPTWRAAVRARDEPVLMLRAEVRPSAVYLFIMASNTCSRSGDGTVHRRSLG